MAEGGQRRRREGWERGWQEGLSGGDESVREKVEFGMKRAAS